MDRKMIIFLVAFLAVSSSFIGDGKVLATETPVITSPINGSTYSEDSVVCELTWTPVPEATKYCYAMWDVTGGSEVLLTKGEGRIACYGDCKIYDYDVEENHRYKLILKAYVNGEFIPSDPVHFSVGVRNSDCQVIDCSIPSTMEAGCSYPVSVTFQNTGGQAWSDLNQTWLRITDDYSHFGLSNRMDLAPGEIIPPGASKTFQFTMTPDATGEYLVKFRMVNGTTGFGSPISRSIKVTSSNRLAYDAKLSGDSLPSEIIVGESTSLTMTATNTGQADWSGSGIYLQCKVDGKNNYYALDKKYLDGQVIKPGESKTFVFPVRFDEQQTIGCEWQMVKDRSPFGERFYDTFKVTTIKPTRLALDVSGVTMVIGGPPLQLHATLYPSNVANQQIDWYSSNPSVAAVNDKGLVTPRAVGHTSIHAVSLANPDVYDTCSVYVDPKVAVSEVKLSATSLQKKPNDIPFQLFATVYPLEANDRRIDWSSSDPRVATVDDLGIVTITGVGTATITASSAADPFKKATCTLVVAGSYKAVTSVSLNKHSLTMTINGGNETLVATVYPTDATDPQIKWISTDSRVATVNSSGVVTPVSAGTATIVARSEANEQKQDTCEVTVLGAVTVPGVPVVQGLNINPESGYQGNSYTFTARVSGQVSRVCLQFDTPGKEVDNNYTCEMTGTGAGVYTLTKTISSAGAAPGYERSVRVWAEYGSQKSGVVIKTFTVKDKSAETQTLKIQVKVNNGEPIVKGQNQDLVPIKVTVSSGSTVKKVRYFIDQYEKYPPGATDLTFNWDISGTAPGTHSVKVLVTDQSGKEASDSKTIEVKDISDQVLPAPSGLVAEAKGPTVVNLSWNSVSGAESYTIHRTQANNGVKATFEKVKATSYSDVTVSPSTTYYYAVTAVTASGKEGKWPEQSLTVSTPAANATVRVQAVNLSKSAITLYLGQSYRLEPVITPANASNQAVEWSSNNPSVASVDKYGVVTAKGVGYGSSGNARITVRTVDGSKYANCEVTVLTPSVITQVPNESQKKSQGFLNLQALRNGVSAAASTISQESGMQAGWNMLSNLNSAYQSVSEDPGKVSKAIGYVGTVQTLVSAFSNPDYNFGDAYMDFMPGQSLAADAFKSLGLGDMRQEAHDAFDYKKRFEYERTHQGPTELEKELQEFKQTLKELDSYSGWN
ncbi:MAG: Ig-like domain-containing protein [Syntrophothermus sp.]|uniref:Ig-like domain-containing protein n=1 Tax=Syntrophothermus sp. TaxID=2736299 RepID=UPI00257C5E2D|nr:Ig-like domain-containing protein [Syntrophothermus sp.]NSW82446.1 Ig-like domain-containing protein [Syntrophothermus sp.]